MAMAISYSHFLLDSFDLWKGPVFGICAEGRGGEASTVTQFERRAFSVNASTGLLEQLATISQIHLITLIILRSS